MVATLQGIGVGELAELLKHHSPAAFLCHGFVPVLGGHVLEGEVAILVLKVDAVEGQQLGEELGFDLLAEVVEGVAVEEVSLFACVGVQVGVEEQPILGRKVLS